MSANSRRRARLARSALLAFLVVTAATCGRRNEDSRAGGPEASRTSRRPMPQEWSVLAWYEGVLPCVDCPGIRTELVLYADRPAFLLRETRLGGIEQTFTSRGSWAVVHGSPDDEDALIYQLNGDRPEEIRNFLVVDARTLRLLDREQHPLVTDLNTTLARIDTVEGG